MKREPKIRGAELLLRALREEGVSVFWGVSGSPMLPFYDALFRAGPKVRSILVRHEQAGVHAADGYWRQSGKLAAAMGSNGPGSTNLLTGLATAFADSIPLLALTFNVPRQDIGKGVFQEVDIVSMARGAVKKAVQLRSAAEINDQVAKLIPLALAHPRGPVLIDVPADVLKERAASELINRGDEPPAITNVTARPLTVKPIQQLLEQARRPVILAGGGVKEAGAEVELRRFAELFQVPTANTVSGVGLLPGGHRLGLGLAGVIGTPTANAALQAADFLLVLGTRLEPRSVGRAVDFATKARIVHVTITGHDCGRFVGGVACYLYDVKDFLTSMTKLRPRTVSRRARSAWLKRISFWRLSCPITYQPSAGFIRVPQVAETLSRLAPAAVLFVGSGQHKYWMIRHFNFESARQLQVSSRFGTMGFALPAAMGAKLADPEAAIIVVAGDGDIQMNIQELATIREHDLSIKTIVIDNQGLGAVRQHQYFNYGRRYIASNYQRPADISAVARAYGWQADKAVKPGELKAKLKAMLAAEGPYLLQISTDPCEFLTPRISASEPLDKLICAPRFD